MKYYSEVLKRPFDTVEELEAAEKKVADEKAAEEAKVQTIKAEKKTLAKAVEIADTNLTTALADLDKAKADVEKIYEEAAIEAKEILTPAKKAVEEAKAAKFKALLEFNKKFGTYEIKYDGDKAAKEFDRITKMINDNFNHWFFRF